MRAGEPPWPGQNAGSRRRFLMSITTSYMTERVDKTIWDESPSTLDESPSTEDESPGTTDARRS